MHLLHVLATVAPNPEPTLRPGLDPNQVTPGPWGFFITFGVAVVLFLLIRDMTKRIRRVRYREQIGQIQPRTGDVPDESGAEPGDGPASSGSEPPAGPGADRPGKYGPGN
ncbi:hypothetical protein LVY72_01685 [Arthrobacter sp. I2-34]|uniref:Uncharacterized protein n=1 Tax=Arthrobacter hankyongi TaxID=2904801 RepID=A0ABS9L285_9MICC|nr:hypothetical protein [Arthrobacter hankyongi]MCG2620617.1 hypothetical protein [Arthrobacter hankyongi]